MKPDDAFERLREDGQKNPMTDEEVDTFVKKAADGRKHKEQSVDYEHFGEKMADGRLTEPSDGTRYRLREAIQYSEELGRPLTEEELAQFEVK
ncbi:MULTISPECIES: hypothetical protein [unclassified Butyrivibrio]|uniref:hypothetical protein n=1 Tax=unclassified Butyrivibrio TaxID=2639466 RepID=UPI0008763EBF|nr:MULTISPECIES: hypothetical protein [unclassified Butyrivibrio]SCY14860.1 hypothetical protein SAMN02910371_01224 [Butyrivibrio sp. INlla14]SDB52210.1 hypothetical protein SAMN02910263_02640 [Butyrivibrio sp. INlla16]